MNSSNYDKFIGELRLCGITLPPNAIIERKGEVYGLDLETISKDEYKRFPFRSQYLYELRRLKLPRIKSERYPPIFHLNQLTHLSMNSLRAGNLPPKFYQLTNLQVVNLAGNRITKLQDELGNLRQLSCLALGSNKLEDLPDVFDQLTNLHDLYLYNNHLAALPPSIGSLQELKILVIEKNKLTQLPLEIMHLTTLEVFRTADNPLSLTPGNYIWIDMLEQNVTDLSALQKNPCYMFPVYYWSWNHSENTED